MVQQVLDGTWEDIRQHDAELTGQIVRLIILGAPVNGKVNGASTRPPEEASGLTIGAQILAQWERDGVLGAWADRTDITDSTEYARQLREQAWKRNPGL